MAPDAIPPPEREDRPHGSDFRRIEAFSDGVLAIAITLLVLQFDVPTGLPDGDAAALADALAESLPDLLAYVLSFAVIGRLWIVHHRLLDALVRFDAALVWLNMLFLAVVVLIPFVSQLLGDYGDEPPAAVAYALILAAAALTVWGMTRYAVHAGLVRERWRRTAVFASGPRGLVLPAVFLLSIPLAFVHPYAAETVWVLSFFVHPHDRWAVPRW